jgi:hypothetical protein
MPFVYFLSSFTSISCSWTFYLPSSDLLAFPITTIKQSEMSARINDLVPCTEIRENHTCAWCIQCCKCGERREVVPSSMPPHTYTPKTTICDGHPGECRHELCECCREETEVMLMAGLWRVIVDPESGREKAVCIGFYRDQIPEYQGSVVLPYLGVFLLVWACKLAISNQ